MKVIYKYELKTEDFQQICMPIAAKILTVQTQFGSLALWALVDTDNKNEIITLRTLGTGHGISDSEAEKLQYIATYQLSGGSLVFHLFKSL